MNRINKALLALALLPRNLYRRWGIDVSQLSAILTAKLIMDDRRPNSIQANRHQRGDGKEVKNATIGTIILSTVMGLVFLFAFAFGNDHVTRLTVYFGMFIIMLCMLLVSDFTSVLIDVRDNQIILPKPVNDRTFIVSRLLHVFLHVCKLVFPMSLPGMVFLAFDSNPAASLLLLFLAVFATLFSVFLINAVYIAILRVTTPERFKSIISYVQIAFAILIYAGSQLLPRFEETAAFDEFTLADKPWMLLVPPYWFAAAFDTVFSGSSKWFQVAAALMAVAVPLLSIYLVVKYLAPAFNQKLAMIAGSEGPAVKTVVSPGAQGKSSLSGILARWLTKNGAERAGFLFTWKMMARSREFKVRVYPSIGYLIVMMVAAMFRSHGGSEADDGFFSGFKLILPVYFINIILIAAVGQIAYSEKYKAAWMFFISPLERPGPLISGALKATVLKFCSVICIPFILYRLLAGSPAELPNILLAIFNQVLIIFGMSLIGSSRLPFANPFIEANRGGQLMRLLLWLLLSGIVALIHFLLFRNMFAVGAGLVLTALGIWFVAQQLRKISWEAVELAD
ncbi:MAG: hypothetical protein L6Q97_11935 [Thermoanaerobaculia bacterium]|nr:hypothetical protein [Thermoanaerobaculia bacterium]